MVQLIGGPNWLERVAGIRFELAIRVGAPVFQEPPSEVVLNAGRSLDQSGRNRLSGVGTLARLSDGYDSIAVHDLIVAEGPSSVATRS